MNPTRFTAACIQMRSGRDVLKNRDAAVALVREAADKGAHFAQTPEMTSLVCRDRAELFDKVGPEAQDPVLAALREVARERGIVVQIGSIAVKEGDKVANRAFLIGTDGEVIASYDKIHLYDVDLPNGESWRESATYTGGSWAVAAEIALGLSRHDHLLRRALRRPLQGARRERRVVPLGARRLHQADRRGPLARAAPGTGHRDRLLHDLRRSRQACTRTGARPSAIPSSSIPGAGCWRMAARSRACSWPRSTPASSPRCAGASRPSRMRGPSRSRSFPPSRRIGRPPPDPFPFRARILTSSGT